jgi:hypothetical protein
MYREGTVTSWPKGHEVGQEGMKGGRIQKPLGKARGAKAGSQQSFFGGGSGQS